MVAVFGLVREMLCDDGTLWVNLGDSYAGYHGNGNAAYNRAPSNKAGYFENQRATTVGTGGLKPKDLCGIPWRVAFALQADGWYLRSDIIWSKPNPMPESVRDRPTKAHEYLFLLSKRPSYYYDAEAIAEPSESMSGWAKQRASGIDTWKYNDTPERRAQTGQRIESSTFGGGIKPYRGKATKDYGGAGAQDPSAVKARIVDRQMAGEMNRNRRTVWTVPTHPYPDAHFATFPPKLIEPCILAGSREGDTVLDPFFGSGTTGEVARRFNRNWIGCELQEAYAPLQERRTSFPVQQALQGMT